jgi:outer membrane protein
MQIPDEERRSADSIGPRLRRLIISFRIKKGRTVVLIIAGPLLMSGCLRMQTLTTRTAPSPQAPWTPPSGAAAPAVEAPAVQIPADLLSSKRNWTLYQLIDVGLGNNMQTRAVWNAARSAAAAFGAARSAYFPRLTVDLNGGYTKASFAGGRFTAEYNSLTPSAALSWLLLDFGGRKAGLEEARQTLAAANWTQNAVIQNIVLQVEQNYYLYLTAKALLKAQETALKEAQTNMDAADRRRQAGVATLADALQAKTALSRAEMNLVLSQGQIQIYKGALANTIGLPANTDFDVAEDLPAAVPLNQTAGEVERFIAEAQATRPDLAAARSAALKAEAHIDRVRSAGLPTLAASGSIGRIYYNNQPKPGDSLIGAVLLDIPLFSGFSVNYQTLQARADAEAAKDQMKKMEQDVTLQVWTSYYSLKTAVQRVKTSQDLYAAAEQSYQVALAGYKEGIGSILELLSAQSTLENGRIQVIQAKADWLLSLAQFARDTGTLEIPGQTAPGATTGGTDKGDK